MEVAVGSELGIWQKQNHDAYLTECLGPSITFFGVADGFGSVGRSAETAPLALSLVRDYLRRKSRVGAIAGRAASPSSIRQILLAALGHANARLFVQSGSHDDFVASGTSMTSVLIVGHHAFIGHVGDARAYLLRYGRLEALTVDDAVSAESVPSSKTALPSKPRARSLLWRTLGTQPKLEASIAHVELLAGDQLVLCTDGIHRCVYIDDIAETLSSGESASDAVARLLLLAKTRGSFDNATVIVGRDLLTPASAAAVRKAGMGPVVRGVIAAVLLIVGVLLVAFLLYHAAIDPHPQPHAFGFIIDRLA